MMISIIYSLIYFSIAYHRQDDYEKKTKTIKAGTIIIITIILELF